MKPIPIIKKELDRNGVIGFLSITKEKLSNFFNRTFVDGSELPPKKERKRKSRTTKTSRRARLDKHPVSNGKVVKTKVKLKAPKSKASKVQITNGATECNGNNSNKELDTKIQPMTNGHSPNKSNASSVASSAATAATPSTAPGNGNGTNHSQARKRKSVSPDKKSTQSDLKSSTKDAGNQSQTNSNGEPSPTKKTSKKAEKTDKTDKPEKAEKGEKKARVKKEKVKDCFDEARHRKFCSTKCNVSNFDDLNELQLELERRLCVIEKYKQTLEFERIRLDKATDISNFLISKPKAKFAKLRSIVLGGEADWEAQLRPPPRMKKSQRSVTKAIQSAHNAFTPLFSLTVSTKAASNYLSSPRIVAQLEPDSAELLKKIIKNFNRLLTNDDLITPLYKPIFTECQLEFSDFVRQLTDTKLEDNYSAEKLLDMWKDQTELYRSLVPSVSLHSLDDFRHYLNALKIEPKSVTNSSSLSLSPCSNGGSLKVVKDEKVNEISPRKKCRQNDGSPSILRQLLSTPPKVLPACNSVHSSPVASSASGSFNETSSISYGTSSTVTVTAESLSCSLLSQSFTDNPLVKLNSAQLDDLVRRASALLTKIRDFAHEFAPISTNARNSPATDTAGQAIFSGICADIDSTAKMCSFMNGNLPIFTSNCLGCQPQQGFLSTVSPPPPPPTPPSSSSSSSSPSSSSTLSLSSASSSSTVTTAVSSSTQRSYPSSAPSSASLSSYTASSSSACSTPTLWTSSCSGSSSQSSSSVMSTHSSSVAMYSTASVNNHNNNVGGSGTITLPDSARLRLMRHCGELCGALTPEPIQHIVTPDYSRPKKYKWGGRKRSSPKKTRRRKPQCELVKKRRRYSPIKQTDDDTEIENDDDDDDCDGIGVEGSYDDFDDIQLLEINDIDIVDQDLNRFDVDAFVESFNVRANLLDIISDDCCDGDASAASAAATTVASSAAGSNTRLVPPFMLENSCTIKKSLNAANNNNNNNNNKISTESTGSITLPAVAGKTRRKTLNGDTKKPTPGASLDTKMSSTPANMNSNAGVCGVHSSDLLDSIICRLVEQHLIPLMQQNRRQIDSLKVSLTQERNRQQKQIRLRSDYVQLLDTIYKYLIKNRAILKKDNDILCKTLDNFICLATELQQPEFWITPEDFGEDFFDSVFPFEMISHHERTVKKLFEPKDECKMDDGHPATVKKEEDAGGDDASGSVNDSQDSQMDVYSFDNNDNNSVQQPQQTPGQNHCSLERNNNTTESINIY